MNLYILFLKATFTIYIYIYIYLFLNLFTIALIDPICWTHAGKSWLIPHWIIRTRLVENDAMCITLPIKAFVLCVSIVEFFTVANWGDKIKDQLYLSPSSIINEQSNKWVTFLFKNLLTFYTIREQSASWIIWLWFILIQHL